MVFRNRWEWPLYFLFAAVALFLTALAGDPVPVFQGKPASSRVNYDLAGTWIVSDLSSPFHMPEVGEETREEVWRLKKTGERAWKEQGSGDTFRLDPDEAPQQLTRKGKRSVVYSINRQRPGFLTVTAADGRKYQAIRAE